MRVLAFGSFPAGKVNRKIVPPPSRGTAWIVPTVPFNDFLADGQPDAVARIFGAGVQAVENDEDVLGMLGGYADAVVGDGEYPIGPSLLRRDVNDGSFGATKLDRVSNQVLEHLLQLGTVGHQRG